MKAQGFDKIANLNDPRYLDYLETTIKFKELQEFDDYTLEEEKTVCQKKLKRKT